MAAGIGILWICIGAATGWLGTKIMGSFTRPSAMVNISIGILGAVVAGFITHRVLGPDLGCAGVFVGLGGALFGGCLLIFARQALSRFQV